MNNYNRNNYNARGGSNARGGNGAGSRDAFKGAYSDRGAGNRSAGGPGRGYNGGSGGNRGGYNNGAGGSRGGGYNGGSGGNRGGDFVKGATNVATYIWSELKYLLTSFGEKIALFWGERQEMLEQKRIDRENAKNGGKGQFHRTDPTWWRITKGFLRTIGRGVATLLLIGVITGCIVAAASMVYVLVYLDKDIEFDLNELKLSYTSTIYVQNGTDDAGEPKYSEYQKLHGSVNREWVDLTNMGEYVPEAIVSIEDHRFRDHQGVDWIRTIRCFAGYFLHLDEDTQGGSTLTQQLIKNITKEKQVSIERKLREIFRALELERQYTKDQILEAYLNVVSFGNGCNGIKSAANTYYDKEPNELTLAEAASIVGITKNPSQYNPLYRPEKNKQRQEEVLRYMLKYEVISQEQFDEAVAQELVFNKNAVYNSETKSYNNWYVDQIIYDLIDELQEIGFSETEARQKIYNGGLQIYSCMDVRMQKGAEAIFADPSNFAKFPGNVQPQCAIAVMDYDGAVKCIVGARGTKSADLV
ncbi:MAG: penicillin-binding protein, partial [Clostridia bacterium]|nr:penicillin-binding protein [Clostridia bacterium]